ncbi:hypothetical protein GCM10017673_51450 [Streptosporangium violaceochromogenes]|nr:hypothetical protein GCM10017673_51450 [Streptosporangium violaceochromogenes]
MASAEVSCPEGAGVEAAFSDSRGAERPFTVLRPVSDFPLDGGILPLPSLPPRCRFLFLLFLFGLADEVTEFLAGPFQRPLGL